MSGRTNNRQLKVKHRIPGTSLHKLGEKVKGSLEDKAVKLGMVLRTELSNEDCIRVCLETITWLNRTWAAGIIRKEVKRKNNVG